ncbi:hypothetical protein [Chryseobacterium turcicum]|uniref:Uncharacterized protein n=1 Tax=Chryseobacterium turcicum TaxID=2898076 RepID=A0A9Q3YY01_9FLAO|nr:hypothetical protein [Chryseobacterium turcicum]MCD1115680.1 hypothetical protein [Chryseobacterium turcicum]
MIYKKYIYIIFAGIMFMSCSHDDISEELEVDNIVTDNTVTRVEDIRTLEKAHFQKEVQFLEDEKVYKSKEEIIAEFTIINKKAPTVHGPFTQTVRKPAYSSRPGGNQPFTANIIYNGVGSYPASGSYVAEIYDYKFKIRLPPEAFHAFTESIDVIGYSNYTTQTVGYNAQPPIIENGALYFNVNTYGIILKYNYVGQLINFPISITDNKTLTYYYLTM